MLRYSLLRILVFLFFLLGFFLGLAFLEVLGRGHALADVGPDQLHLVGARFERGGFGSCCSVINHRENLHFNELANG